MSSLFRSVAERVSVGSARTHARRLGVQVHASEFVKTFGAQYVSMLIY